MSRLSADATSFGKHSFRQGFLRKVEDDQYITRTIETLKTRRRNFAASLALSLSLSLPLSLSLSTCHYRSRPCRVAVALSVLVAVVAVVIVVVMCLHSFGIYAGITEFEAARF